MNLDLNSEPADPVEESAAVSMLIEYEVEDLERELRAVRKKERKHFIWALTGISPAALIPMFGLFLTDSYGLLILLALLVPFSQLYMGVKASGKASRLKKSLEELRGKK